MSIFFAPRASQARATANYYKCVNKVGGEWNFGRAPNACNANSWGDDRVVLDNFAVAIFADSASRNLERRRYMEEVHAIVRDAAAYYIKKRKPAVSQTELDWFVKGIVTTAAHESYDSHYRRASDGRLKIMRGDVGHGHGLMQIDDRGHFPAITNGTAWNLITNITYGMDIFYEQWQRAPSQKCVGSATNYEARVRAAWAAYNGGPAQICRWTKTTGTWAQNDKNFKAMLRDESWEAYVPTPLAKASINVPCLVEKRENCPKDGGPTTPTVDGPAEGLLLKIPSGAYCSREGSNLHCVAEARDAICLRAVTPLESETAQTVTAAAIAKLKLVSHDRHEVCLGYDATVWPVGTLLEMKKNIFVRATPGGGKAGIVLIGDVAEVLDFELREPSTGDRYYKIRMGAVTGWVFGGDKVLQAEWTAKSKKTAAAAATLALAGDKIRVLNAVGINMRATPGGKLQARVPAQEALTVLASKVQGGDNGIYYQVKYGGKTGYIYSGHLLPTDTTADWTARVREY